MLSRVALLTAAQRPAVTALARGTSTSTPASGSGLAPGFERPVRLEYPGKVRMGFIPDEWFQYFYPKTGVTGPYVFGAGLITYLCSKEIYVMEHEYYSGLSILLMVVFATKKFGPQLAAYLDKEVDKVEDEWNAGREAQLKELTDDIEAEKKEQWRAEGQMLLLDAKKENVALQLEAAYRERAMTVYNEVKRRLDYQVQRQNIDRRISQKWEVEWVVKNVLKAITPDQEAQTLNKCIADLGNLASQPSQELESDEAIQACDTFDDSDDECQEPPPKCKC